MGISGINITPAEVRREAGIAPAQVNPEKELRDGTLKAQYDAKRQQAEFHEDDISRNKMEKTISLLQERYAANKEGRTE